MDFNESSGQAISPLPIQNAMKADTWITSDFLGIETFMAPVDYPN